jgi:saccharopine dehydrogenase (NAD+, L-lysine-forming)
MGKALIIGCGGVASVAIHKCCQNSGVFEEIMIASRTKSKCDALAEKLSGGKTRIHTAQVDADNVGELIALIMSFRPDVVLNLALPYQDLTIMDACLATKTDYVDTANYEPPDTAKFEYKWQWAYRDRYKQAGVTALWVAGSIPASRGFCRLCAQASLRRDQHYRYPRRQRRRPRLPLCHKLQPRDQHPRGHSQGQLLGKRALGRNRADGNKARL